MQSRMKKLAIMLLVGCLLFVAISNVCADDNVEVDTFKDMNGNISDGNNVTLKDNIVGLDGIINGIEINRNTTVDGNGHYIDAQQQGRFFNITNGNAVLTLKNITLKNGKVGSNGGAIYGDGNVNIIANDNVCFNNNTAKNGAAIYTENGNVNIIANDNVCFNNNIASQDCGAIYSHDGMVNITSRNSNVTFENNKAGEYGGAINSGNVTISTNNGDIIFDNNIASCGGAIDAWDDSGYGYVSIIAINGIVCFKNNKANKTDDDGFSGGAILDDSGSSNFKILLKGEKVIFDNNTANGTGGAIQTCVSVNITAGSVEFTNNKALTDDGGAIRAFGEVTIQAAENIIFTDNFAKSTGENDKGGAGISAYKHLIGDQYEYYNITLTSTNGNISFCNNTASKNGGAILGKNINITAKNMNFIDNKAIKGHGGAIFGIDKVIINCTNVILNNNNATGSGGSISASNGIIINSIGDVTLNYNVAFGSGGAIYSGSYVNITSSKGNVILNNNIAKDEFGGAIYSEGNVTIIANDNVNLNNNMATTNSGGAITTLNAIIINSITGIVSLNNNTAGISAGAIYGGKVNIIAKNVEFISNNASNGDGGAIYAENVNINNAVFYGNNATDKGKCICLSNGTNSSFENCFWGLNYKDQTGIKNDYLIAIRNTETGTVDYETPDYWLLLNIIPPKTIICDINNTFQIVFNQITNGNQIIDIKPIIANILVNLTENTNKVQTYAIGYFNFTTDHVGDFTIHVFNIFNNKEITNITFTTDNSPFSKVAELIKENTTINLEKDYNYYQELDYKLANGIKITRNTTINGNGHYLDAKNLATIFQVNKGSTLTLKNIKLLNANIAIINNGVLDLTNVTSKSAIRNNGVITSGVKFIVYSDKVTTYDSYLVSLRTVDDIPIMVSNLKYSDDQGHNYKAFIYNKGFYVNYVPEGITGHVTFNNVELNGFTNLTSEGSLDITKYPKTSNNIVKSVSTNIINNPVVKNINSIIKNTVKDIKTNIFKLIRA